MALLKFNTDRNLCRRCLRKTTTSMLEIDEKAISRQCSENVTSDEMLNASQCFNICCVFEIKFTLSPASIKEKLFRLISLKKD